MSGEVWQETYKRLSSWSSAPHHFDFREHAPLSERMHSSSRALGAEHVAAHHGSLAKEARLDAEASCAKAG